VGKGIKAKLEKIVGKTWVGDRKESLIVQPKTAEEISGVLRLANRRRIPVRVRGGGTGWWSSTQPPAGGILISMERMNRVLDIDEDSLTVTVEAGIPFQRMEEKLTALGYRILLFPESKHVATLGGHVATWGTSPYATSVFEDQGTQIVGLRVVLPTGEVVQTGSGAVKTSAGNFARRFFPGDLTGIFIGAEGAFGILVEVTLKMYRRPEVVKTRIVGFPDLRRAADTLRKVQERQRAGGLPTLMEQRLVPKEMLLAGLPRLQSLIREEMKFFLVFRCDGEEPDVQRHIVEACQLGVREGGGVIEDDVPERGKGQGKGFAQASLGAGPKIMLVAMVPLGRYMRAVTLIEQFGRESGLNLLVRGYPFGGPIMLVHANVPCADRTPQAREKALRLAREIMEAVMEMGGVPHRVGSDFLPVLTKRLDAAYYDFVKKMKKFLDPHGIMSPGLVIPRGTMRQSRNQKKR